MELDCERVAIGVIEKHLLPIDIPEYCKKANAYVHFYNLMKETRKWYSIGKEPYNIKEIVDIMPDNLDDDCTVFTEEMRSVMMEHCA